jgi:hypothetical protein
MSDCVEKVPSTEATRIRIIQIDTYIRLLLPSQFALERPTSRWRSAMPAPASRFRRRVHDVEKIWLATSTDFFNSIGGQADPLCLLFVGHVAADAPCAVAVAYRYSGASRRARLGSSNGILPARH